MSFDLKVLAFLLGLTICSSVQGSRILLDDFSIPQEQRRLTSPDLTFGARLVSSVRVADGSLGFYPVAGNRSGRIAWPGSPRTSADEPMVNLTGFVGLEFEVSSLVEEATVFPTFAYDNGIRLVTSSVALTVREPGIYQAFISGDVIRDEVYYVGLSLTADSGSDIVIDNVWLVVPETNSLLTIGIASLYILYFKRNTH